MKRLSVVLLLAGQACSLFGGGAETGWRPLEGTPHVTPKQKLTFYWVGPGGVYQTPDQVAVEIDRLFLEWCEIYEARWGFGLSREQRRAHLARLSIQLFAGDRVRGREANLLKYTVGIYWPWEKQIDVAMAAKKHFDEGLKIESEGLDVLRHEWSHVFQGEYHP